MSEETKVCPGCGLVVKSYAKYCAECGSYIPDNNEPIVEETKESIPETKADFSINTNYARPDADFGRIYDRIVSKTEYFKMYADKNTKSAINTAGILCFVLAGLSLPSVIMLFSLGEAATAIGLLLDVAVYVGLGLGAYLKKSKGCILASAIYYGIGLLLMIGSLPLATIILRIAITAGLINGYIKANKFDDDYKYYVWVAQNKDNLE